MGSRFALRKGLRAVSVLRLPAGRALRDPIQKMPDGAEIIAGRQFGIGDAHDRDNYIWLHAHHWVKTHTRARTIEATSEALPNK